MKTDIIRNRLISVGPTLLLGLSFFFGQAQATGATYDGIYQWSPGNFLSVHQDGTHMIVTIYFNADGNVTVPAPVGVGTLLVPQLDLFDLMDGEVTGSTATIDGTRFHRACNVGYDFKFNIDSSITVTRIGVSNTPAADSAGISCSAILSAEGTPLTVPKIRFGPNSAPVANAGSAQNVATGTLVTLNGGASTDANSDPLTYAWTLTAKPPGSAATLSSAASVSPSFTPDVSGTYIASLTVNDGSTSSSPSSVTVNVVAATSAGALVLPVPVSIQALTLGTPHADVSALYGSASITVPGGTGSADVLSGLSDYYPPITQIIQYMPVDHITSELVSKGWVDGWNGYGQTISLIDDFQTVAIKSTQNFRARRQTIKARTEVDFSTNKIQTNTYVGTYDVDYSYVLNSAHGSLVSNIAVENEKGSILSLTVALTRYATNELSCTKNGVTQNTACGNASLFHHYESNATVDYHKVAGIAKSASVIENQVILSANQNPYTTSTYVSGHLDNSYQASAINLSLGTNINTSGVTFAKISDDIANNPVLTKKSEAVIAVAAGNSGGPCDATNLAGCNYLAAYLALAPQTKESVLVVGATTGTGSNEKIASYSTRAGAIANRFILASGDTGYSGVEGTSFAAPRVTAAAAIVRQKYPNLTASQVANLLLLTASKDINNDGVDEFSGVSPIYGYGKLDLVKALSPIGTAAIGQ